MTPVERFEAKFIPEALTGCWIWTAYLNRDGYGHFGTGDRKSKGAHRFSYEYYRGAVPKGLELDHLCRNRACVNPDHLEAVTHRVNVLRGKSLQTLNAAKTGCLRGHAYDQFETGRRCRVCTNERKRNYWQRQQVLKGLAR